MNKHNYKTRQSGQQHPLFTSIKIGFRSISNRLKNAVLTLAVWGFLPNGLADRFTKLGGSRDE